MATITNDIQIKLCSKLFHFFEEINFSESIKSKVPEFESKETIKNKTSKQVRDTSN